MKYLYLILWVITGLTALIPMREKTGYIPGFALIVAPIVGPIALVATIIVYGTDGTGKFFVKKD